MAARPHRTTLKLSRPRLGVFNPIAGARPRKQTFAPVAPTTPSSVFERLQVSESCQASLASHG